MLQLCTTTLNSNYWQNTEKFWFFPQYAVLPLKKDLVHFSPSAIQTITVTYSCANEKTTVVSPLRLLELLDCHLGYKEQEETLSQKLHLAPKAEDLRKRNSQSAPCYNF